MRLLVSRLVLALLVALPLMAGSEETKGGKPSVEELRIEDFEPQKKQEELPADQKQQEEQIRKRVPVEKPDEVKQASLSIESSPPGATVYVDGAARGKTPITFPGIPAGSRKVRLVLDGYKDKEEYIQIEAGKDILASFKMERLPSRPETSPVLTSADKTWREPVTGMEFAWVPKGCFQMGCGSWTSDCYDNEKPVRKVCLDGYWIGRTEVTQGQWKQVMGSNPSHFTKGSNFPVESVSWNNVKEFIRKIESQNGGRYRFGLPTEAEWEYACTGGGKAQKYAGGENVDGVAWYSGNSGGSTQLVGGKAPNGLGLYDMSGNVWEWCEDAGGQAAFGGPRRKIPIQRSGGPHRMLRGGSWFNAPRGVRCAIRNSLDPGIKGGRLGFRLVRKP
jgi:formylglycine-generating enzyme required for sulfatase activity